RPPSPLSLRSLSRTSPFSAAFPYTTLFRSSTSPVQQRLAGASGDFDKLLGLGPTWSYDIIKQVGNYRESFERNLAPLGIERGPNRLWKDGGLLYSPAFR